MLTLRIDVILLNPISLKLSIDYTKDVLRMVDHVANFKMGKALKEDIQAKRSKILVQASKEKREERQEEIIKKKAEKQKEKEAKISSLPPDQQRRLEEKEYKRKIKQQNKKMVKIAKK